MISIKPFTLFFVFIIGLFWTLNSCSTPNNYSQTPSGDYNTLLDSLTQKAKSLNIQDDPEYFVHYYDSLNEYLLEVPNTEELKKELRFVLKNKMRDLGIINEAIRQSYFILNEARNPDRNDSISFTLMMYGQLSGLYGEINEKDSVEFYQFKSITLSKSHEVNLHQSPPLNNRGMVLLEYHQPDSAIIYFKKADSILQDAGFLTPYWENFRHSIDDNIAMYYEEKGQFHKTIPIYRKNFDYYEIDNNTFRKINAGISLANALIENSEVTTAKGILDTVTQQNGSTIYPNQVINTQYLFQIWAKYYSKNNEFELAREYEHKEYELFQKESNKREEYQQKLTGYLAKFAEERTNQKIQSAISEQLTEKKNHQLQLIVFVLVALTAALAFVGLWVQQRNAKQLASSKAQQIAQEKKLIELDLEFKKKDLVDMTLNISQKQEWAKVIQSQLKLIQSLKGNKRSAEFKRLNDQVRAQVYMEKELNVFNENIDILNAEYYVKLKSKFPELTKTETQLCSFIKLNLTNAQICQLKNIDPNSVLMQRYRLKKKINLNKEDDLDAFVKDL